MSFTFYGDLLGISSLYKLSPSTAHEKLNDFYDTTFFSIGEQWELQHSVRTLMFSDSLLITGRADPETVLEQLLLVYMKLLHKGLLLRGAIVDGELDFEPRITRDNFKKMLPKDDTLARAAGLEGTQKGARLLIEPALARTLLSNEQDWLTQEGYVRNVRGNHLQHYESVLRRICPTPDGSCYELLYFWVCSRELNHHATDYRRKRDELNEIKKMVREDLSAHYKETAELLSRCESRHAFTDRYFNISRQDGEELSL
ncbi:MAG: hypothetical protein M1398_03210 [Deltaproteobacteria bacterium]|nr:hypothetical protein [Deltaproteobacteria bacterium]